jgi:hypothetical protein
MLRIAINQLVSELGYVISSCTKFVEDTYPLESFKRQLEQLNRTPEVLAEREISIPVNAPLKTIISYGGYEKDDAGQHNVFGSISFIWRVSVEGGIGKRELILDGLMSTTAQIINASTGAVLASWNFDIGNADAPGCHFHVQACWPREQERGNWPNDPASINVPRLPIPVVVPTDALEFLLGELFQEGWGAHRARFKNPYQTKRLIALFEWQIKKLQSGGASAWQALKAAKPEVNDQLFAKI